MSNQTLLKMTEAAEMVGMTRPTFYRKIKELNLSTVTDHSGRQKVEVSELIRVFGSDVQLRKDKANGAGDTTKGLVSKTSKRTQKTSDDVEQQIQLAKLEAELEKEKALRTQSQDHVDYLKTQLEAEKAEKNKMNMILTDQRQKSDQAEEWGRALKTLESRIANQESDTRAEKIRAQKILKQNKTLKRALLEEKNKSFWQRLFG